MNRNNIILAVLLVLQLAVVVWVFRPAQSGYAAVGPLVANVTADNVTAIKVQDNTNQVNLTKSDAGWVAPEAGNYPAEMADITKLISDVVAIDTSRLIATTPASHARLKVSDTDFMRRIELQTVDGTQHVLFVGTSPSVNTAHVRLNGKDAVYLTSGALSSDVRTDLAGWINTSYVQNAPEDVTNLTVQNATGTYQLSKDTSGKWTLPDLAAGEAVTQEAVAGLVNQISSLNLTRPLGKAAKPEYGLGKPQATVTFAVAPKAGAPVTITLAVGALDEAAGAYVAKASSSDYYVTIGKFLLDGLVKIKRPDLVASGATPGAVVPVTATAPVTTSDVLTTSAVMPAVQPATSAVTTPLKATAELTQSASISGTVVITD